MSALGRNRTGSQRVGDAARALIAEHDPGRYPTHPLGPGTVPAVPGGADAWRPRARTLAELLADPRVTTPPRWVLPPLVESGEVALLSAPPKTGKSHFASQLAAELSRGGAALDGTPLAAGAVLWLALDEPARRLVPRLTALGADAERFRVVEREPGHVLMAWHLAALLAEYRPALVVLDTTSQLALDARADPNDGAQVGAFLRPLVDAVRDAATPDAPCAGLFIHHAPHHAARAAGSLQWGAIVDADVVLRRKRRRVDPAAPEPDDGADDDGASGDDGARVLEGVTRAEGPLRLRLTFAAGRYALAGAPSPLVDRLRAVLAQLNCGPRVSSAARLRDRLNCKDAALRVALGTLESRGEVRVVGAGRSPQCHYVPTDALRLYLTAGEEAGRRADDAGRSGESTGEEVTEPGSATSSRVHAPTRTPGKKYDAPPVLGEYGADAA